jgi:hypothetical protein
MARKVRRIRKIAPRDDGLVGVLLLDAHYAESGRSFASEHLEEWQEWRPRLSRAGLLSEEAAAAGEEEQRG